MTTTEAVSPRVVVVTGAGSGVGRSVAHALLVRGHHVVLAGRRRERLIETAGAHASALVAVTDVRDPGQTAALFDRAVERFGHIDALVNNAGVFGPAGSVDELTLEQWDDVVATNLTGTMLCAGEAIRRMRAQTPQGGRIINNGSLSAQVPRPRSAAYTATKHAITGLTRSIGLDGRDDDITCTQIDIGNAATEMTQDLSVAARQPDGSLRSEPTFDPVHVADAVCYLVDLPVQVSVPALTIMASGMPFHGRG